MIFILHMEPCPVGPRLCKAMVMLNWEYVLPHDAAGSMKIQIQILQDLSLPGLHGTVSSLLMVHVDGACLLPVYENCNVLTVALEKRRCVASAQPTCAEYSRSKSHRRVMSVIPASERS